MNEEELLVFWLNTYNEKTLIEILNFIKEI